MITIGATIAKKARDHRVLGTLRLISLGHSLPKRWRQAGRFRGDLSIFWGSKGGKTVSVMLNPAPTDSPYRVWFADSEDFLDRIQSCVLIL